MFVRSIISPNRQMISQFALFLKSCVKNSRLTDYSINLTVGPESCPGIKRLQKICGDRLSLNQYTTSDYGFDPPYLGGIQRWQVNGPHDVSLFIDADVLVCGSLCEVEISCRETQCVHGVANIGSPFRFSDTDSRIMWNKIAKVFQMDFKFIKHLGVGIHREFGHVDRHFHIPENYLNYGFVLVPEKHRLLLCEVLPEFVAKSVEVYGTNFWNGEIALCAAMNKYAIPVKLLDLKYNYPDRQEFFDRMPSPDIRILHMVKKKIRDHDDAVNALYKIKSDSACDSLISSSIRDLFRKMVI